MTDKNEILKQMTYSYSSLSTYSTCPLCFKLTYIDRLDRANNAFASAGTIAHMCFEAFWKGKIEEYEIAQYFKENYPKVVIEPFPPYPPNMADNYYNFLLKFFEEFEFDKSEYDILFIEDKIESEIDNYKFVVKPDLVLHHKKKDINFLLDYKSANIYKQNGKLDDKKIDGYHKQLTLYAHFITLVTGIKINKLYVWAIRQNKWEELCYNQKQVESTLNWAKDTLTKISQDEEWIAKPDKYFCQNICSMRNGPCIHGKG